MLILFYKYIKKLIINRAHLAQLAERKTEDLEVAGSTPAAGSQNFFVFGKEDNVREHVVNNCKK